jgi:hypothetical protein
MINNFLNKTILPENVIFKEKVILYSLLNMKIMQT